MGKLWYGSTVVLFTNLMSTPLRAFIIEDDPSLASIFAKALSEAGFEVQTAADGRLGLDLLATTTPHVVILDLHLPLISGEQLLRHIRTAGHLRQTQVVIVSADAVLAGWLHNQADFVLTKPVSYNHLRTLSTRLGRALQEG
jgi:two-component system, OmpR family, response regulator